MLNPRQSNEAFLSLANPRVRPYIYWQHRNHKQSASDQERSRRHCLGPGELSQLFPSHIIIKTGCWNRKDHYTWVTVNEVFFPSQSSST